MANVLDQLLAAVAAYREAQDAVGQAELAVVEAKAKVPVKRQELAEAIVAAHNGGVRQRDIVKATGYTRENVRLILRNAGIEAE